MAKTQHDRSRAVPEERPASPANAAEGGAPPKFGTGRRIEEAGETPRIIDQLDRAPAGCGVARFKVRADGFAGAPARYVLAASPEEARACYEKTLGDELEAARRAAGPEAPGFGFVITRLPD